MQHPNRIEGCLYFSPLRRHREVDWVNDVLQVSLHVGHCCKWQLQIITPCQVACGVLLNVQTIFLLPERRHHLVHITTVQWQWTPPSAVAVSVVSTGPQASKSSDVALDYPSQRVTELNRYLDLGYQHASQRARLHCTETMELIYGSRRHPVRPTKESNFR
jgi:hypothetical protein